MSTADELAKLHQLHKDGVITAEEFAAQKAKLLAGDVAPAGKPAKVIDPVRAAKAKQLVAVSNGLAGSGIVGAVLGVVLVAAGITTVGGVLLIVIGVICTITGAIIGQVGRGMQGRAI